MHAQQLTQYIADTDKRAALARAVGTSPQYLWQLASGWRGKKASPALAQRIEDASGGAIHRSDLRPDIWSPADVATTPSPATQPTELPTSTPEAAHAA